MTTQNIICAITGILLGAITGLPGQEVLLENTAGNNAAVTPVDSETGEKMPLRKKLKIKEQIKITGGQLTLPFKIRPKAETRSFRLTTDVTVGAYVGLNKRLMAGKDYFLTIPLAAGLTFINLNDSNTSLDLSLQEAEVVPGLTWSTGIILQLESYNLGFLLGKDYASEIGDQWQYHSRLWWSFGIGFTFFH